MEGLRELVRAHEPEGRILLLEHVRPRNRLLGWLADLVRVITRHLFGFAPNRSTDENVTRALRTPFGETAPATSRIRS